MFGLQSRIAGEMQVRFDQWVASELGELDILHCLSGFGVSSHRRAREVGGLTVCDRGSTHILQQERVLSEEFARWELPYVSIDARTIGRELEEYRFCDRIVVPSEFAYRTFIEEGVPEEKLRRISYGVELGSFRPEPKRDEGFTVLYAGGVMVRKGLGYLLLAMQSSEMGGVKLRLAGTVTPDGQSILERYPVAGIEVLGSVPRDRMSSVYSQASVLVFPSVNEGFGLVMAQAMACGLPLVATKETGATDLIEDGVEGFVIPSRDPEAIVEKVAYLRSNPDVLRDMGAAAARRVRSLGGWNDYGTKMLGVYQDLRDSGR
jgi:glycosyltransferase involved in cell wall biosynthesis